MAVEKVEPPAKVRTVSGIIDWTTVLLAFIAAVTSISAPFTAYYLSQIKSNSAETVELAGTAAVVTKEIHTAVNSNYQEMIEKLDRTSELVRAQNERILQLSVDNATADEQQRSDGPEGEE